MHGDTSSRRTLDPGHRNINRDSRAVGRCDAAQYTLDSDCSGNPGSHFRHDWAGFVVYRRSSFRPKTHRNLNKDILPLAESRIAIRNQGLNERLDHLGLIAPEGLYHTEHTERRRSGV